MDLLVLAKDPVAGRVKTRLCPPCSPAQAAAVAEAARADTLTSACAAGADRVVLALDGRPGDWCPAGVDIVDQGDGDLAHRLTRAWSAVAGPAVQIGMDTPQLTAAVLDEAMAALMVPDIDAVLGPAEDGGWWGIGLRQAHPLAFAGIPTSRPDTGRRQAARLSELGLRTRTLACERDVDTWTDAVAVAFRCPAEGRFADQVFRVAGDMARTRTRTRTVAVAG
jgi:rSAM/selenodomain-associated transferase 1